MAKKMPQSLKTIIYAGSIAGSADIAVAVLRYYVSTGKNPIVVLQYIASGVFGKEAFTGDSMTAILGLVFHFIIAFSWTTLYFVVYSKVKILSKNKYISGFAYGFVIWCGMNLVILPLSNVTQIPFTITRVAEGVAIVMVCVGLPLSIIVHRHYSQNT